MYTLPSKLQKTSGCSQSVKHISRLAKSELKALDAMNEARLAVGLSVIKVKIRNCIACGRKFESTGKRVCGCRSRKVSSLLGIEVI